jgi:NitT/TauT family transport system ATP-binding protein
MANLTSAPAAPDDDIILRIDDLSFGYDKRSGGMPVLSGFSLTLARGEFVAIVGPSGIGKSTLLRIVSGLAAPSSGAMVVGAEVPPGRRALATVFQDSRLLPWRRVLDNVCFGLEGIVPERRARVERARAALDQVGLSQDARKWPHQLSGGQQQRVGLARALAVNPALLLMDEPFSALDTAARRALQDEIALICQSSRMSNLFITHDLEEAVYLADRIVLVAGRPARPVNEFAVGLARPRCRETAVFGATVETARRCLLVEP